MKASTLTTCLVAAMAMAASFAAGAQTINAQAGVEAQTPASQADVSVQAVSDANAQAVVQDDKSASKPLADDRCLRETGTLIKQRDKDGKRVCIQQAPGRSYSNEDINRTGQTDLADALRHLDASIH